MLITVRGKRFFFSILFPYFSYKSTGEKLLKYQENSPWVIISLILMTSGVEQALIFQGEI